MRIIKQKIGILPSNFKREKEYLTKLNISTWDQLKDLTDKTLYEIVAHSFCSINNLKKLRNIALFVTLLKITQHEASILMHSGITSIEALSRISPQELMSRTGRLERKLNTTRETLFQLKKANYLIEMAKKRQNQN
tara:strand:+ start:2165 stop:2572 length:408 start_codon:yes stop_codon:yes gene_type:complete